ncbi:MAG: rhodanese-like domain-containing protein [Candidatus Promineifilaceae bacterium]
MLLEYVNDRRLAQASYFVGCQTTGRAIVIDPTRDIAPYLALAKRHSMRIVAAAETHIQADFISGARELAARQGARLNLSAEGGPEWAYAYAADYDHQLLRDNDVFEVGTLRLQALHMPGHTPEHLSFLLTDTQTAERPMGLFSGDFVFVADVGRPDLLELAAGESGAAAAGARQLFASLDRFRRLPDYLQLWPGHGAGSACGQAIGAVPSSTVGYEKLFNWALQERDEAALTRRLLASQPEPPRYFGVMKRLNRQGPPLWRREARPALLAFDRLAQVLAAGLAVVDARPHATFAAGHIPGAINIPHTGSFVTWAGWLLDYDRPFYLLIAEERLAAAAADLAAIGLDNCAGYWDAPALAAWQAAGLELERTPQIAAEDVAPRIASGEVALLDVRSRAEWAAGHVPGAGHIMLGYLPQRAAELARDRPLAVHCESGYRSAIGVSLLQAQGFSQVMRLAGGLEAWQAAGLPVEGAAGD